MDAMYLAQDIDELDVALSGRAEGALLGKRRGGELLRTSLEIEAEARRLDVPDMIAKALVQRARVLMGLRHTEEAIAPLTTACNVLGSLRTHDLKVSVYAALAEAQASLGDWRAVSKTCEAGLALVEAHRYSVSGQYLQSSYLRSRIGLYAHGVRSSYENGKYDSMLQRAELSKCRSVLRQQQRCAAPTRDEKQTELAFREVCEEIDAARAEDRGQEAQQALLTKRRNLWDLLLMQRARLSAGSFPEIRLADLQRALANDEAVLYYYWLDDRNLLIVLIGDDCFKTELVPVSRAVRQQVQACASGLIGSVDPGTPKFSAYLVELDSLAGFLLPEALASSLQTKTRLFVSPHRMLHAVPFHALLWNGTRGYLIERFAITYVPNLTCLLMRHPAPKGHRLLALGIAHYQVHGYKARPLPDAENEVADLSCLYSNHGDEATALCGPEVSKDRLRVMERAGELQAFTTLHIAAHGHNVSSDTPMESHLLLYDSLLDGLEVADWRLGADLVVLSACCSGQRAIAGRGMAELPGDDLFGLQAAFFAAGAKRVLGSLWPVYSHVARRVMTAFHRFLLEGQTPERALQSAVLEYLAKAGPESSERIYWAPFFLSAVGPSTNVGNGRAI